MENMEHFTLSSSLVVFAWHR